MNLVLKFREYLAALSQGLLNEFEQIVAAVNTVWAVEHAEDGTHVSFTSPTASITPEGDATFDGNVSAGGDNVEIGSLVQSASPSVAGGYLRLQSEGGLSKFRISAFDDSDDELRIADLNQTVSDYILRLKNVGGEWFFSPNSAEVLKLGRDALGERITDLFALDAHFSNGVYERSRSARIGEWTTVAYTAGDFTGNGLMTFTVQSGDLIYFAYSLVGKTMTVSWRILTASVGGTPNTSLQIKIPGGFTAAGTAVGTYYYNDNGTFGIGYCVTSGTNILLRKPGTTNWTAAANTSGFEGTFSFEVA